jgi:hypothetical protein
MSLLPTAVSEEEVESEEMESEEAQMRRAAVEANLEM